MKASTKRTVHVAPEVYMRLRAYADEHELPIGQIVEQAVAATLEGVIALEPPTELAVRRARARAWAADPLGRRRAANAARERRREEKRAADEARRARLRALRHDNAARVRP